MNSSKTRRFVVWQLPFWGALVYWSFVPSRLTVIYRFGQVPIDVRDIVLTCTAILYGTLAARRYVFQASNGRHAFRLLRSSILFLGYAAVSLGWSALERTDVVCMSVTLVLFLASVVMAYAFVYLLAPGGLESALRLSVLILAAVCLTYSADSFFQLNFRSADHVRYEPDFPIPRVSGPLFAASTGYFIILPALAFALEAVWRRSARRIIAALAAAVLGITLFALGSRGSVLLTGIFAALLLFFLPGLKRKLLSLASVAAVVLLAVVLILQAGEATRIASFTDDSRVSLHTNAWNLVESRSLAANVFGSGYGSVWPWYRLDDYITQQKYESSIATRYDLLIAGKYLYHPHSVLLLLAVEVGIVGMLFFAGLWMSLIAVLRRQRMLKDHLTFACGLVASGAALFLDLFLFYRPRAYVLWWFWLFAMLRVSDQTESVQRAAECAERDPEFEYAEA